VLEESDQAVRHQAASAHLAGLLGATVFGWLVAAGYSWFMLLRGRDRRSAYLAVHAAQAALFQLVALAIEVGLIVCAVIGFLFFAGDIPGLPSLPLMDLPTPLDFIFPILWLLSGIGVPVWYVLSLLLAIKAARRVARGEHYLYPVIGDAVFEWLLPGRVSASDPSEEKEEPSL
jgi:uncharacterized Tic20 family protein